MSLVGIKLIEFAGMAPGPFAGVVLSDNGASVIRIDKPPGSDLLSPDVLSRRKRSLAINPKIQSGRITLRRLIASADVVIDPFRPGVMEKLGLGPEVFLGGEVGGEGKGKGLNEKLIYARLVGFSKTGPHKDMAGHDINYLALSGILSMLPGTEKPTVPLNLVADFAGGGLLCALGILLALIERGKTGLGQVVNIDMVSGTRYLSSWPFLHALDSASHLFSRSRTNNLLDGAAPFYGVYTCKDGRWMTVGCLESKFYAVFLDKFLQALPHEFRMDKEAKGERWRPKPENQYKRNEWPTLKGFLECGFRTNTRDYWEKVFHGTDACVVPVLTVEEAGMLDPSHLPIPTVHPQVVSASTFAQTPASGRLPYLRPGEHTQEILTELGLSKDERRRLALDGALGEDKLAEALGKNKL